MRDGATRGRLGGAGRVPVACRPAAAPYRTVLLSRRAHSAHSALPTAAGAVRQPYGDKERGMGDGEGKAGVRTPVAGRPAGRTGCPAGTASLEIYSFPSLPPTAPAGAAASLSFASALSSPALPRRVLSRPTARGPGPRRACGLRRAPRCLNRLGRARSLGPSGLLWSPVPLCSLFTRAASLPRPAQAIPPHRAGQGAGVAPLAPGPLICPSGARCGGRGDGAGSTRKSCPGRARRG